jgi:hypothetical protein
MPHILVVISNLIIEHRNQQYIFFEGGINNRKSYLYRLLSPSQIIIYFDVLDIVFAMCQCPVRQRFFVMMANAQNKGLDWFGQLPYVQYGWHVLVPCD